MRNCILVLIFTLSCFAVNAQEQHDWQQLYDELMTEEEQEELMNEENYGVSPKTQLQVYTLKRIIS